AAVALGAGIHTTSANSGYQILNNIIQNNTVGVYLNSSGATPATIQQDLFRTNNNPGSGAGSGIYSDQGLVNASVDNNTFTTHDFAAMYAEGTQSGVAISSNNLGGGAVLLANTSNSSITGNTSTGNTGFWFDQIRLFGNDSNITIACNTLSGGMRGIRVSNENGANSGITINTDNITGHSEAGLRVDTGSYTGTLDASDSYWGAASGPKYNGAGPGTGDDIVDPDLVVDYTPFATSALSCATLVVDDNFPGPSCSGAAYSTINAAIAAAVPTDTIRVCSGSYNEDVTINKNNLKVLGSGAGVTTVHGPIGGSGSTLAVAANNVTVAGFTITRDGNNTTDWNNPGLNTAGISVQGASTGMLVRDNIITGMRTGIDVNNSSGHTIRNNVIDFNRTGMILRNVTDFMTVVENQITNNWTVGILFLDASGGSNVPLQTAAHSAFSNNNLSGNWYGQIVDRQSGGSLPAPNTINLKNFRGNWLGTATPFVTTANSTEPGYAAQIPVAYGGSAVPPGGQPDVAGAASDNFRIQPILLSGTDTNIATPGWGTFGFQGNPISSISPANANARGWFFFDDNGAGVGSTGFEVGEGTPPLGTGSAFFQVDNLAGHAFEVFGTYHGTRMDDITSLRYSSYQNGNANPFAAVALQFDIDYDLTDGNNAFQGRLVFEPYQTPSNTVQQLTWQNWDAVAGRWWATGGAGIGSCPQATPCPWTQILTLFPQAGVRNTVGSGILFKAGSGGGVFDGNVDALKVGIRAFRTTYNYEPTP
ncbi:MAG TPA: right-handed parallel beta-helix repeat-containing protein, partial [Pyrinomonadaceae bacterium]|nr:right-handed parallel beta-helix repeat-containing protein [Pyrinomonadaceae bacterium]